MDTKVLAVCAHVDDIQITCGGTLLKFLSAGAHVKVVYTVGFEARKLAGSMAVMGIEDFEISEDLEFNDLPVQLEVLRTRLDQILAQFKPNIVFTHHIDEKLIDHEVTARTVIELAKRHRVRAIYNGEIYGCSVGFEPDVYVDIGDTFEQKMESLHALTPEVKAEWILPPAQDAAEIRGKQCGAKHAEAFAAWPPRIALLPVEAL